MIGQRIRWRVHVWTWLIAKTVHHLAGTGRGHDTWYICKIIMCKCKVGEWQWLLWAVDKVKDVAIDLRFPLITESHHSKHVVHLNMWEALNWRRTDSLFFLLAVSELSGGCHRPLESAVGSPSRLFCLSVQLSVSCWLDDWLSSSIHVQSSLNPTY